MRDSIGRTVRYLRLSITPACPMSCVYCRPTALAPSPSSLLLTAREITDVVQHLVKSHGVRKVRLTGGEPTTRPDLLDIIRSLAAIEGLEELALTTNGLTLATQAQALAAAGLRRVNISLDSLNRKRFERITGIDGLRHILDGIKAAQAAGLAPVKLNTVVIRGENEDELPDLLCFAVGSGVEIRFIELMPMGALASQWAERFVPVHQMRQRLNAIVNQWEELPAVADSARRYRVSLIGGRMATVGFITAMSCPFCASCDRIRIGSDGSFYPCLMAPPAGTLHSAIRPTFDPQKLDRALKWGLSAKAAEHPDAGVAVMTQLGG